MFSTQATVRRITEFRFPEKFVFDLPMSNATKLSVNIELANEMRKLWEQRDVELHLVRLFSPSCNYCNCGTKKTVVGNFWLLLMGCSGGLSQGGYIHVFMEFYGRQPH